MSPGPSRRIARVLRPEWEITSLHEAGHAVAQVVQHLPLHEVQIDYARKVDAWGVHGSTTYVPEDSMFIPHDDTATLAAIVATLLAGPEAEAQWIQRTTGCPLSSARIQAAEDNRDGDFLDVQDMLGSSGLTRPEADRRAWELVGDHWVTIESLAARLRAERRMSGDAVRELIRHGGA